ncbi:MAG: DUF5131 family protein [Janthinobacterium lividum]
MSAKSLQGPLGLSAWIDQLEWVITGGETGHHARPSCPSWFTSMQRQCAAAQVAFHLKQWGHLRRARRERSEAGAARSSRTATPWCDRARRRRGACLAAGRGTSFPLGAPSDGRGSPDYPARAGRYLLRLFTMRHLPIWCRVAGCGMPLSGGAL